MCGRCACTLGAEDIQSACSYKSNEKKEFERPAWIPSQYQYKPSYNVAPTATLPVLIDSNHIKLESLETERAIVPMRWGMVPPWLKKEDKPSLHTHNCRIETIQESKLYKPQLNAGKRCLVICDGYYEWQTTNSTKQPYFIYQDNKDNLEECKQETPVVSSWDSEIGWTGSPVLKMAGLFNTIKDEMGNDCHTCTILTAESNETFSWLHHRMPFLLQTEQETKNWLDYKNVSASEALNALKPIDKINYYPVDKKFINNSRTDTPDCKKKISLEIKRNSFMDNWLKCTPPAAKKRKSE